MMECASRRRRRLTRRRMRICDGKRIAAAAAADAAAHALRPLFPRAQLYTEGDVGGIYMLPSGNATPITVTDPSSAFNAHLRFLASNIPLLVDTFRRYTALYKKLRPTLYLRGGLPAVLRAAPELAVNADQWMVDNGVGLIAPFAAQSLIQTGCVAWRARVRAFFLTTKLGRTHGSSFLRRQQVWAPVRNVSRLDASVPVAKPDGARRRP